MARYDGDAMDWPRVPWDQFTRDFTWQQGEHMLFVGETGSGKTTLESLIVPQRRFCVVFATKQQDDSLSKKRWPGFTRMQTWQPRKAAQAEHVILWPASGKTMAESRSIQQRVFSEALDSIFKSGGWCVVIDEMQYMIDMLGFDKQIKTYLHQGRSSGITVVSGAQRPANVPVVVYGASLKFFVSRQVEGDDVKRLAAAAGVERLQLEAALPLIPEQEWLYIDRANRRPGVLTKARLPR